MNQSDFHSSHSFLKINFTDESLSQRNKDQIRKVYSKSPLVKKRHAKIIMKPGDGTQVISINLKDDDNLKLERGNKDL